MALRLRSKAFEAFKEIPRRYTAEGEGLSPPLKWSGVPDGTHEFVLICEDPDAPTPKPFLHWMIYHLTPNTSQLPEGLAQQEEIEYPVMATQGRNTLQQYGYTGPNPPLWHGPHHYYFKLYALDSELSVAPDAGRTEVLKAMKGHVIDEAQLVGFYERRIRKDARSWAAWFDQNVADGEKRAAIGWLAGGLASGMVLGRFARRWGDRREENRQRAA